MMRPARFLIALLTFLALGCDEPPIGPCDALAQTGCDDGLACETLPDGATACFAPVVIEGRAFDLATDTALAEVRIVALDVNGSPQSSVVRSTADGRYRLALPTPRAADGAPLPRAALTLRADAAGYLTFPSGIRPALPIDTANPTLIDGRLVISSPLTELGLIALAPSPTPRAAIRGHVARAASGASVLVVAETTGTPGASRGASALADRDGDYEIFNLAAGDYAVHAYAQGQSYAPGAATLAAGETKVVDLELDAAPTARVSGNVQLVNPGLGEATSVILVVESTFDENVARGDAPPGLRAPEPGTLPSITGGFTIEGVPAGRYVVLAAFENDHLVRDASSIGGTDIVHQEVLAGVDVTIDESFKLTGAVEILAPGADGPEEVEGTPVFRWVDDSSEDRYDLVVHDALGQTIWTHSEPSGNRDPMVSYGGPALESGMHYQLTIRSIKDPDEELSRSENLRGVFFAR